MTRWVLPILLLLCIPRAAAAVRFDVVQITDNEVTDQGPTVDGAHVAWLGSGLHVWHQVASGPPSQLSTAASQPSGALARVSGDRVLWQAQSGDLFLHDGSTASPLPAALRSARSYDVDGSTIAYTKGGELYLFDGTTSTQITFDLQNDTFLDLSGSGVAVLSATVPSLPLGYGANLSPFVGNRGGDVRFYDGSQIRTLSTVRSFEPSIDGGQVAWYGWDGHDRFPG